MKLKTAEKRAIIAEKMVKMFSKELDAREGMFRFMNFFFIFSDQILFFSAFTIVFFQTFYLERRKNTNISAMTWTPRLLNSPDINRTFIIKLCYFLRQYVSIKNYTQIFYFFFHIIVKFNYR